MSSENETGAGKETSFAGDPLSEAGFVSYNKLTEESVKTKYLIEGVLIEDGTVMVYADEGAGKSYVVADLACTLASTRETWQGHAVNKHGIVIYVAAENRSDQPKRMLGWAQAYGLNPSNLCMYPENDPINLVTGDGVELLIERIQRLPEPPVAIYFDTVSACAPRANLDGSQDATALHATCDRIRLAASGATIILVTHKPKPPRGKTTAGKGTLPLGSTTLANRCQERVEVTRTGVYNETFTSGDTVTLTYRKMSSDPLPPETSLPVRVVEVEHKGETATAVTFEDKQLSTAKEAPKKRQRAASVPVDDVLAYVQERGTATKEEIGKRFSLEGDTAYRKLKSLRDLGHLTEREGVYEPVRIAA